MRITLAGFGYVGKAFNDAFFPTYSIKIVDPKYTPMEVEASDTIVVIAIGTPYNEGCDISEILKTLDRTSKDAKVLIKSTVDMRGVKIITERYPHHCITYSPEFLRGETASEDFSKAEYHIFGGGDQDFWIDLYKVRFPLISFYTCTAMEASVIKYAENSFLGMKVAFFNQLSDVSDIYDVNFEVVRDLLTKDKRINDDHSMVTEERGYGGHCLPKDINTFINNLEDHDYVSLMSHVKEYNERIRKSN